MRRLQASVALTRLRYHEWHISDSGANINPSEYWTALAACVQSTTAPSRQRGAPPAAPLLPSTFSARASLILSTWRCSAAIRLCTTAGCSPNTLTVCAASVARSHSLQLAAG